MFQAALPAAKLLSSEAGNIGKQYGVYCTVCLCFYKMQGVVVMCEDEEKILKAFDEFLNTLNGIDDKYKELIDYVNAYDRKEIDWLHSIEPSEKDPKNYDMHKSWIILKNGQDIRSNRRVYKNFRRFLEPLNTWFINNRAIVVELHKVKTKMAKILEENKACFYRERYTDEDN
jgi:hypothetical protein